MSIQRPSERETTIEEQVKPQLTDDGTTYVCLPKGMLRKAGFEPDNGDIPEELGLYYTDGGDRDGMLESDLKENHE